MKVILEAQRAHQIRYLRFIDIFVVLHYTCMLTIHHIFDHTAKHVLLYQTNMYSSRKKL
jgi:hypothetical protein